MTLSQKQRLFSKYVGLLLTWCYLKGYEVTFGETYRTPEQAALNAKKGIGIAKSLHTKRLAIDLNLFINGRYVTDSAAYKPLGLFWKSLDANNRWGGEFSKPDGGHFSYTHEGIS
jgi:hypothetical protein